MKVLRLSQQLDREAWLELRRGKATGSKAKGLKYLSRGTDRTPAGFWQLLAEKVCITSDGEKDIDRGQRLENEALEITAKKFNIELDLDPGMWLSDDNQDIAVSPDAAEPAFLPTYAAEAKCLSSANHLKYVIKDQRAQLKEGYNPIDSIPDEYNSTYREQVVQYFVVCDTLRRLYFTLYDDRVAIEKYAHHVIVVERDSIIEDIAAQKETQLEILHSVDETLKQMVANGES